MPTGGGFSFSSMGGPPSTNSRGNPRLSSPADFPPASAPTVASLSCRLCYCQTSVLQLSDFVACSLQVLPAVFLCLLPAAVQLPDFQQSDFSDFMQCLVFEATVIRCLLEKCTILFFLILITIHLRYFDSEGVGWIYYQAGGVSSDAIRPTFYIDNAAV